MAPPLDGLTVVDFSHALAGPYCTMLMAAYGARVFKIEGVDTGDMGRTWGPPFLGGESCYFLGLNAGKQALAIDGKHPRGRDLCRELAAKADILVENMRPGAMERLGLSYAALAPLNPRLVYCSISGFGQNGPARDDAAMDLILQAASGLISVTGTPDGELVRCGHSVADVTAGMFALIGVLMALRGREQTGRGQWVDVAMFDGMISAMASNYAQFLGAGELPRPMGTGFATIVPYACFPTADRPIAIAVASESLWRRFCLALAREDWLADTRLSTNALRVKHRGWFERDLTAVLRLRPAEEWVAVLGAAGVPCSPVRNMAEVKADPQAAARGMFPVTEHPKAGPVTVTGLPVKMEGAGGAPLRAAPLPAQHTCEALTELLGLSAAELDTLLAEGVIRQA